MGKGLVGAFEVAMAGGKPVLTTVSEKHRSAWEIFAPGAIYLIADEPALHAWWSRSQTARSASNGSQRRKP
jgi:hypothetical protein